MVARVDAGELSSRTAGSYEASVAAWLLWLDRQPEAGSPSPDTVRRYVHYLRTDQQHKPGTVGTYLAGLRALYTWAEARNVYPAIARSVKGPKANHGGPLDCLETGQVAGLLAYVDGQSLAALRDRALVHVLFSTALRLVSLTAANQADYHAGELTYQGKGDRGKSRSAYLSRSAVQALEAYLAERERVEGPLAPTAPLFTAVGNRAGGKRLSSRSLRRIVTALMEAAGHVQRGESGKVTRPGVLSAHSLRRSAITAVARSQGIDAAQVFAGHKDRGTTERFYARVEQGRTLKALAQNLDLGALK